MNEPDISRETNTPPLDDARISGAINKILEHPELIGMIGSMLQGANPPAQTVASATEDSAPAAAEVTPPASGGADMLATLAPMLARLQSSGAGLSHSHKDDKREHLLLALKPYLSRERCEAIDQMLKISRISDVFKNMS